MKTDKFLIGIVVGIFGLIIVATVVVLARGRHEAYATGNTPADVVHNYFLAIQREDYEKAYSYLSDDLKHKPDLDEFITTLDNYGRRSEAALKIGQSTVTGNRATVDVSITTYSGGDLFSSRSSYTSQQTAHLRPAANGEWKLIDFPYPYWGYNWNRP